MSRSCPSCGGTIREEDTICPTCGEPLAPGVAPDEAPGPEASMEAPTASPAAVQPPVPPPASQTLSGSGPARTYLIGGIVALAIAGIIFIVAAPDSYTVLPQGAMPTAQGGAGQPGANGQMPQGHPPVEQEVPPEVLQQIAAQEKVVAASPQNLEEKLKLANLYFDVGRHAEALPLYREYVQAHPDNDDARTDMANSIANTGNIREAMAELGRVVARNPKHQNAAFNLSMMYVAERNRDSAVYWMERVYAIDSTTRQGKTAAEILQGLKSQPTDSPAPAAQ